MTKPAGWVITFENEKGNAVKMFGGRQYDRTEIERMSQERAEIFGYKVINIERTNGGKT
jgi:hypothetical protein